MPRAMQAEAVRRGVARVVVAAMVAALAAVAGPVTPKAEAADLNPCNLPGGKQVCDTVEKGAKLVYEGSGAKSLVEGVEGAMDFASDPLGYIEQKLRRGTQGMFEAFGEALTGKKPPTPAEEKSKKTGGDRS